MRFGDVFILNIRYLSCTVKKMSHYIEKEEEVIRPN